MQIKEKIEFALLKEFIKGTCFLCRKPTEDPEAYVHYVCAEAYQSQKEKVIKEAYSDKI